MEYKWKFLEQFLSTKKRTYLAACCLGLLSAIAWAIYIKTASHGKGITASLADFTIIMSGSIVTQMWSIKENDIKIFLLYDICSVVGTYLTVRFLPL